MSIRDNLAAVASENAPVSISRSVDEGQTALERRKTTGLAGAAAAMSTLVLLALIRRQPDS